MKEFDDKNESKKQAQDKDDEQISFKRGVVALNYGEVLARNNERIPVNTIARLVDFVFKFFVLLGHKRRMPEGNITWEY